MAKSCYNVRDIYGRERRSYYHYFFSNYINFISFPRFLLVNEVYSKWGRWYTCDVTCGGGRKWRYRTCPTSSRRAGQKVACVYPLRNSAACNSQPCPQGMLIDLFRILGFGLQLTCN